MEMVQRVRKTDLVRNMRQVIQSVQRGQTALIESHGQPEVAIVDIIDYRLSRAVLHYHVQLPEIDSTAGLPDEAVEALPDEQARYNLVMAHYLADSLSLARTAELLGLTWLDLRTRCLRLDIPLRVAPVDRAEAEADVAVAKLWKPAPKA